MLSAAQLLEQKGQLESERTQWIGLWQDCASYCLPRKTMVLQTVTQSYRPERRLVNTTAVDANNTLASGCLSWITPDHSNWFAYRPSESLRGIDRVEDWLADCTSRAEDHLKASNFYTRIHETFLDRGCFGTSCLYLEDTEDEGGDILNFSTWEPGSFVFAENNLGVIDTVFKTYAKTAKQAKEEFGEAVPAAVRKDLEQNKLNAIHFFTFAIYPRPVEARNPNGGPGGHKYAACWIHDATKEKIKEGGFAEFPAFITRWLRWSESSGWGVSPAMMALADTRGVNYLDLLMTTLAETTVNPRIIASADVRGGIDLSPGGVTQVKDMAQAPQEWMTKGRIHEGIVLIERKEALIRRAFHVDLFNQFAELERSITAHEVRAREAEKLSRFSPAFTLLTTELINPCLQRVFLIMMRKGYFPKPPPEAIIYSPSGRLIIPFPSVVQTSRMSLALHALKRSALFGIMELFAPLTAIRPELWDNLDVDRAFRDMSRSSGLPAEYLIDEDMVAEGRAARAQAAQQQQMAQAGLELAKSQPEMIANVANQIIPGAAPPAAA